jgi:hypothetical protein
MAEIIGFKDGVRERPSRGWRAGKHLSEKHGPWRRGSVDNFVEVDWPAVGESDGAAARAEGSRDPVDVFVSSKRNSSRVRRSDWQ